VQFAATATDPDGHAVNYAWDLDGDGMFETAGQNPTFTCNAVTSPCCASPTTSAARRRGR
jgi:PKD repeat protein